MKLKIHICTYHCIIIKLKIKFIYFSFFFMFKVGKIIKEKKKLESNQPILHSHVEKNE